MGPTRGCEFLDVTRSQSLKPLKASCRYYNTLYSTCTGAINPAVDVLGLRLRVYGFRHVKVAVGLEWPMPVSN